MFPLGTVHIYLLALWFMLKQASHSLVRFPDLLCHSWQSGNLTTHSPDVEIDFTFRVSKSHKNPGVGGLTHLGKLSLPLSLIRNKSAIM